MTSLIPIMALGNCKEALSCRGQKTSSHMTCSSRACGKAVKGPKALNCDSRPHSAGRHSSLFPLITPVLFRRVSSATWCNTHKSKEDQSYAFCLKNGSFCTQMHPIITCACIPALTSPVFVGLVQTRFAQYLRGFLDCWWCRLCVKKRA